MRKYDETKWLNGQGEQLISGSLSDEDFEDQLEKWFITSTTSTP
jgi:hypothetical protein